MVKTNMHERGKKGTKLKNIIVCEKCGSEQITTYDTRTTMGTRRRRKACQECNHRFTTYEIEKEEYEFMLEVRKFLNENRKAGYEHGYAKGIDDFAEKLTEVYSYLPASIVWALAEQMKGGAI